jgi:hypothetical protein
MDKDAVPRIVYEALEPGGAMVLVHHALTGYDAPANPPAGPPHPPIPHAAIEEVLRRYLGRGRPPRDPHQEPYAAILARSPFGGSEQLTLPGRRDLVRSPGDVIDNYLSTSFAAPELFGPGLHDFRAELAEVLAAHTDTGLFWEWPGDTEALVAVRRPAT